MATTVTFNGTTYSVPAYGDSGWAQGTGNLSSYLIAIAAGTLQTTGGAFTLSAEVDFGATYGLKVAYVKSETANIAGTGVLRLASTDTIAWRNNLNNADIALSKDTSDRLKWGSSFIVTSSSGTTPTQNREVYIAGTPLNNYTGSLTVFNLVGSYLTTGKNLDVFVNGLSNDVTLDYTETSTTSVTFASPLNTGDRVKFDWTTY